MCAVRTAHVMCDGQGRGKGEVGGVSQAYAAKQHFNQLKVEGQDAYAGRGGRAAHVLIRTTAHGGGPILHQHL